MRLADRIHQTRFASNAQEAVLNVLTTSAWLQGELARLLAPHGVTPAQYNVLRILRGSHPEPLPCSTVGDRLLDRTPDVTRLLDRIQRAGLIERERATHDRRVVEVRITEAGLAKLAALDPVMQAFNGSFAERLSETEARTLSDLLDQMRGDG
ncbi:MAG: MarR family transcriptional regulator [Bacteroidetes bacterium]|nr:MarR family transcriptional regulator [Bacteroidota bacterium]